MKVRVLTKQRGCPAAEQGIGCGCLGICRELVEVVSLEDAARLAGALEARTDAIVEFVREGGRG